MPVWKPLPVEKEPRVVLHPWCRIKPNELMEVNFHLVGIRPDGTARVSSRIVNFGHPIKRWRGEEEEDNFLFRTRSGRLYLCLGEPLEYLNTEMEYLVNAWLRTISGGVTSYIIDSP
jgi:hypothetical protein